MADNCNYPDNCLVPSGCEPGPWSLSQGQDVCLFNNIAEEASNIGAADLHIFKLLGIHEQGNLTDLTGFGVALSGGDQPTFEAANAFGDGCRSFRSLARGDAVLQTYLGYDFGEIKLDNGRNQYGVETYVQKHITTIVITQSENKANRITKARVERSIDGKTWFGTAIVTLPDNGNENMLHFKQSVAVRFWRLRPVAFNGGANDYWEVRKVELMDYAVTDLSNVQDEWGFLENRDREYSPNDVTIKGIYDLTDSQTDLSRFGLELPVVYTFRIHFSAMVARLGRPIIIGDIIEIPSEAQYAPDMTLIKKYVEVTDTSWATDGFTPGWKPIILKVVAAPMMAKQETMDIVGDFVNEKLKINGAPGFLNINSVPYAPTSIIANDRLDSKSRELVPEMGEDDTHFGVLTPEIEQAAEELGADVNKLLHSGQHPVYVRDAMPPGGEKYTEGPELPDMTKVKDGAFHRLTYPDRPDIMTRLYKFSLKNRKWVYMESDYRQRETLNNTKAAQYLNNKQRVNINEVM